MSEWFENFSDNIEDNAGAYAALGGLVALNNQRAQINKLAELQKAQARAAKTEQEREQIRLEHHQKMQERAKAQGKTLPDKPPADRGPGMGPGTGGGSGTGPGYRR